MLKITNNTAKMELSGVLIPNGGSELTDDDWAKFCQIALSNPDSFEALAVRSGAVFAAPIDDDIPDISGIDNPGRIRAILDKINDTEILKKILIACHRKDSLWLQRILIYERFSYLGVSPNWSTAEIKELDRLCPSRLSDRYKNPEIKVEKKPDYALDRFLEREAKKREVIERHKRELSELGY